MDKLEGKTQAKWDSLSHSEKEKIRDYSNLSPQLMGYIGYRVEVETTYGEKRRFIVGQSTGWRPINLEINNRRSLGGIAAEGKYKSVRVLYYTR